MEEIYSIKKIRKAGTLIFLGMLLTLVFVPTITYALNFQNAEMFASQARKPTGIQDTNVNSVIGIIIKGGLTLVGTIFFILMIYGGFLWFTARGNEDTVTKAKNVIIAALIGISLVVGSYAITDFVTKKAISVGTGAINP